MQFVHLGHGTAHIIQRGGEGYPDLWKKWPRVGLCHPAPMPNIKGVLLDYNGEAIYLARLEARKQRVKDKSTPIW